VQRVKRFIPVELTLYLPTPDIRLIALPLSACKTLGNKIRYYRLEKGLTQEDLAALSGISKTYLVQIEKSNRSDINPLYIERIANALEINPLNFYPFNKGRAKNKNFIDYIIPPTSLGSKIKNLRLKQGLTLKEFTKKVKLSKDCIWRYEKGIAMPSREILFRIASSLNVSVAELTKEKLERRK